VVEFDLFLSMDSISVHLWGEASQPEKVNPLNLKRAIGSISIPFFISKAEG
jgi:hypothetical protein